MLFSFAIIFIAFYIVNASNDPQLRHIDKILVNKTGIMKFYMVEIMLSILIPIFWMKQSGSNKHWKNQPKASTGDKS
ncbi:hypothetical protein BANRA_03425 [Escherichia coli]|nr:hypothetical protein BANRA_03425 [Escherichia coli]